MHQAKRFVQRSRRRGSIALSRKHLLQHFSQVQMIFDDQKLWRGSGWRHKAAPLS